MRRMTPTVLLYSVLTLALGATTSCVRSAAKPDEGVEIRKRKLRLVSVQNKSTPIFGEQLVWLTDSVDAMSAGNLKLQVFEPDKLVGALEVLDAVDSGKVDAGYSSAGYWSGKMPAAALFSSVPFGPNEAEFLAWFYHGNGMQLYQEMYDRSGFNVKVFVCGMTPPETSGWFSQRIESEADLKGLKMRFFGLGGEVMKKLGVSVRLLPPAEIYPALEKGVIDATEFAFPSSDESFGFYKIANYNYFPGWHQQATTYELLINADVWQSLAPSQQAMIEVACRANLVRSIAVGEGSQGAAIRRNADRGVNQIMWSDEMIERFREAWEEVVAEQSSEDEFFAKVWTDLEAFRQDYHTWSSRAHMNASRQAR